MLRKKKYIPIYIQRSDILKKTPENSFWSCLLSAKEWKVLAEGNERLHCSITASYRALQLEKNLTSSEKGRRKLQVNHYLHTTCKCGYKPLNEQLGNYVLLFLSQEVVTVGWNAALSVKVAGCCAGCQRKRFNFCAVRLHHQNSNTLICSSASNTEQGRFFLSEFSARTHKNKTTGETKNFSFSQGLA